MQSSGNFREKFWDELTLEEKLDRTRAMVKGLKTAVRELSIQLDAMQQHQHGSGGAILVPWHTGQKFDPVELKEPENARVYF